MTRATSRYKRTKNTWDTLRKKQNIELLENILEEKNKQFEELREITSPIMTRTAFHREKHQIKKQVEEFLGVESTDAKIKYRTIKLMPNYKPNKMQLSGITTIGTLISGIVPEIIMGSTYLLAVTLMLTGSIRTEHIKNEYTRLANRKLGQGTINIVRNKKYDAIPVFGHEYTHALQDKYNWGLFYYTHLEGNVMAEGHARGIERYIAKAYTEKEKNNNFMNDILKEDIGELKSVYTHLKDKYHITINDKLIRIKTYIDNIENAEKQKCHSPTTHAIGNTLFLLAEAIHGDKIYKEYFHGRLEVIR